MVETILFALLYARLAVNSVWLLKYRARMLLEARGSSFRRLPTGEELDLFDLQEEADDWFILVITALLWPLFLPVNSVLLVRDAKRAKRMREEQT